jgi:hypothetical protein
LAARLQVEASDALDLSQESDATKEMYGLDQEITHSYGKRCLMARRLVERGVRFVQIFIEGQIWDAHSDLEKSLRYSCGKTDKPAAALIRDLKQRGLLDSTLIVWGGEFGRMPLSQVRDDVTGAGRDHGPSGFTLWTNSATKPSRSRSLFRISTRRCSTCWAWISGPSLMSATGCMSA